jgi:hypothetical protein
MRPLVLLLISKMPKGHVFELEKLYSVIYATFPKECQILGFTDSMPIEPKWKNDIRFGLRDARDQSMIKHIGTERSGQWQRL